MTSNMNTSEKAAEIQSCLTAHGWEASSDAPALARRTVNTAVGPKDAWVYFYAGDAYNHKLCGVYYSEGRNALSGCEVLVPVGASREELAQCAKGFSDTALHRISQTYAARLLIQRALTEQGRHDS